MERPTTRLMERSNTMTRGKRALEGEEEQPERKRPALARWALVFVFWSLSDYVWWLC